GAKGTNPEELIAAAHAACLSMALSAGLEKAGRPVARVETTAACTMDMVDGAPKITKMALTVRGKVPGLDQAGFQKAAEEAKRGCAAAGGRLAPPVACRQARAGAALPMTPMTPQRIDRRDLLALVGALLVAAVCVRLGLWQLDRLHQRRAHNALVAAARARPELELPLPVDSLRDRRLRAHGAYDYARERLWHGRSYEGIPGVDFVTPLRLSDGT